MDRDGTHPQHRRRLRAVAVGLGLSHSAEAAEPVVTPDYLATRLELIRAINAAPSAPKRGEFSAGIMLVPCMEILGIHIAHVSEARLGLVHSLPCCLGPRPPETV
jgi:hypothetical protein